MKRTLLRFAGIFLLFQLSINSYAQHSLTGKVLDAQNQKALAYVSIAVDGTEIGTSTDFLGNFKLQLPDGKYKLLFSYIAYGGASKSISIEGEDLNIDPILLSARDIYLEEVSIISSLAQRRKTPVSVNTIKASTIAEQLGDQPYPEIMKMVSGVYPSRYGGGSGDARVSIRGFQQENIALLLNGIPISSVENGLVYWNNWIGLSDASNFVQIQKGLGASKTAINSVGGTINIITKTTNNEKGGSFTHSMTDYGNTKTSLSLSTGKMKNGVAVTFMGSHTSGSGYVDATKVESWAYFLSVGKDFGKKTQTNFYSTRRPRKAWAEQFKIEPERN
jgi:iron complex outermembrane recepter protein